MSENYSNKNNPLVSVAIATYNGEKYIKEQIESILNQTYKNIEIIICDDNSTDNTIGIINEYFSKYNNIKYFVNKNNLGLNNNFAKAIKLCTGEYIAISDQDDIWFSEKIEILLDNIDNNDIICSKKIDVDTNKNILPNIHWRSFDFAKKFSYNKYDFLNMYFNNILWGCTSLAKKEFLLKCLPFPANNIMYYDHWLCLNAFGSNSLKYIDQDTIYHRVHSNNVTWNNNHQNPYLRWFKNLSKESIKKYYKKEIKRINLILSMKNLSQNKKEIMNSCKRIYLSILAHRVNLNYIKLFMLEQKLYKKINRPLVFRLKSLIERLILVVF